MNTKHIVSRILATHAVKSKLEGWYKSLKIKNHEKFVFPCKKLFMLKNKCFNFVSPVLKTHVDLVCALRNFYYYKCARVKDVKKIKYPRNANERIEIISWEQVFIKLLYLYFIHCTGITFYLTVCKSKIMLYYNNLYNYNYYYNLGTYLPRII